jgi:tetratricopeptide (TPR) repeat protein
MQSKTEKSQLLHELLTQAEKICKTNIFKAQSLGQPAYDLAEELGDENAMAKAVYYLCMGFCNGQKPHNIGLIHKALQMIEPSEEIFIIRFYNLLGLNELNKGCQAMAVEYFNSALELAEKIKSSVLIVMILNNFGELFRGLEDMNRALVYYQEAYELIRGNRASIPDRYYTCVLDNLVICHSALEQFEEAKTYLDALEAVHSSGKTDTTWFSYSKGAYYKSLCSYELATKYFGAFIEGTEELNVIEMRIGAFRHLGDCYMVLNKNYQALDAYNRGYELAKKNGYEEFSIYAISKVADLYKKMNNVTCALEAFEEMSQQIFRLANKKKDMHSDYMVHKMKFNQLKQAKEYVEEEHRQALLGHQSVESAYQRLDLAVDIGNALKAKPSLRSLLILLSNQIGRLMKVSSIGIARYNLELDQLNLIYIVAGGPVQDDLFFDLKRPEKFNFKTCVRERSSVMFKIKSEDTSERLNDYKYQNAYDDIQSAMYVPIISDDSVKGILTVQCKEENAYNEEDLKLLEVISAYFSQISFCDDEKLRG